MLSGIYGVLGALVGVGSLALVVNACGDDCSVSNTCGGATPTTDDGGSDGPVQADGGGDVVQVPADCNVMADPKDSPACVVDGFGVFVDATSGADRNPGTKAQPVQTIGAALGKLGGKPRVYVCEGTYAESVKLTAAVSVYGGFACGGWTYSGTKAKVAPTAVGYALVIDKVSDVVMVEDVSFSALAGTDASPSSIAAFANGSPQVTLRRVELVAGKGFAGKSQAKAADGALMTAMPTAGTLNGNAGSSSVGGFAQLCTCVGGGTSKGGGGGNIGGDGNNGETAQTVVEPAGATGAGQTGTQCAVSGSGTRGSDAPNAAAALRAMKSGVLTETGWAPELGQNGTAASAGQGGGGGGGAGGGGGGGACGGCGGSAGQGGGGGGASVALLALQSPVTLAQCVLTTSDAGEGGAGGAGGAGLAGGTKGARGGAACDGGNGGKGGNGGAGGGGAGGLSVGVLYKGTKPAIDAAITTGAKGSAGTGAASNNGVDGQKADSLEAP